MIELGFKLRQPSSRAYAPNNGTTVPSVCSDSSDIKEHQSEGKIIELSLQYLA